MYLQLNIVCEVNNFQFGLRQKLYLFIQVVVAYFTIIVAPTLQELIQICFANGTIVISLFQLSKMNKSIYNMQMNMICIDLKTLSIITLVE